MKFLTKLGAMALLTSTFALAWNLEGTVTQIGTNEVGDIRVDVLRTKDAVLVTKKFVLSADPYKQEKLAILLTAKSLGTEISLGLTDSTITAVTAK